MDLKKPMLSCFAIESIGLAEANNSNYGPWMLVDRRGKRNIYQDNKNGPINKAITMGSIRTTSPSSRKAQWRNPSTSAQPSSTSHYQNHKTTYKTSGHKTNFIARSSHDVLCSITESPCRLITPNPFECLQSSVKKPEEATSTPFQEEYSGIQEMKTDQSILEASKVCEHPNHQSLAVIQKMEIPKVLHHKITCNQEYLAINPEIEAIHLIASEWWIKEARVMIELNMESYGSKTHSLRISSTRAMVNDRIRVRKILGTPDFCPLPHFPKSSSMKLLVWNCRGVGNKVFKPSTHVDPVGKYGSIWILWDPFKATVMALDANTQVIHAKIKRDNFQDWILSAVYASPNPRLRDAL
ncbi:hypothetical protein ACSBR1_021098 [Camellia fascicularis]